MLYLPQVLKRCSKCGELKLFGEFRKNKNKPDGLFPWCKICHDQSIKVSKAKKPEHYDRLQRDYRETHKQESAAYFKVWYAENRDDVLRRSAKYRQQNSMQIRMQRHGYYIANRTAVLARNKRWVIKQGYYDIRRKKRADNPGMRQEESRRYNSTHRDVRTAQEHKRRARKRSTQGSYTAAEWQALKAKYGFKCLCCGRSEPDIKLTVDHVIPLVCGGSDFISNIQPLCGPCNFRKHTNSTDYR